MANSRTVPSNLGVNSLTERVEMARKGPGKLQFGTRGFGTSGRLPGELVHVKTGARIMLVPDQGNAQATKDHHLSGVLQVRLVDLPAGVGPVPGSKAARPPTSPPS